MPAAVSRERQEDVKCALRKQFGSVAAFERLKGLPEKSVTDIMRGYTSARVKKAVEEAIGTALQSDNSDSVVKEVKA